MANLRIRTTTGVGLAYACVVLGIVLASTLIASLASRAAGTPVAEEIVYDTMLPPTNEGRARFGEIFIGEVIAIVGKDTIPTSDPEDVLPVILYEVQVEQTLKGAPAGRVRIWFEGFDYRGPDSQKAGELRVGERYLFFAGFDPENNWYPVNAGLGVLPVKSDREAATLAATFEPLIREAARRADQVPEVDPCEKVGLPTISVEPQQGDAGDEVRVSGNNFVRPEVSIWWDGTEERLTSATTEVDCSIATEVTIPKDKTGTHRIVVLDARGQSAEATFEIIKE